MIGPFVEAVRASSQPCTVLLVLPSLTAVLAVRARWSALFAALVAAVVGGWLVAANWYVLDGWTLRLSASVVVVALGLVVAGARREAWHALRGRSVAAAIGGGSTLVATMWWRPCVGDELGSILTAAQHGGADLVGQLVPMLSYMVGAMVPVIAAALVVRLVEPGPTASSSIAVVAGLVGAALAASLVLGHHDDVVVTLTRWTLE